MSLNPALAHYADDPDKLIGTAWTFVTITKGTVAPPRYVEVVAVVDRKALLIAACNEQRPLPTRWVYLNNLLAEIGAFDHLGPASGIRWIRRDEWAVSRDASDARYRGAWQITHVGGAHINLTRNRRTLSLAWAAVLERFRAPAPDEHGMICDGNLTFDEVLPKAPEVPEEALPPVVETPVDDPAPSAWDRLLEDEGVDAP